MTENKANAISVSLLNRKIYAVCYTGIDTLGAFHGALYNARRRFLETGKTARVREAGIYDGTPGEVRGKVSRRGFKWEKTAGGRTLEAAFSSGSQRGIAFRDPDGALRARIYFDREQHWVRTEYPAPDDDQRAKVSFKPDDTRDAVLRFDYSRSTGKTKETTLFPVPYAFQTAEQSLQNAHCGNDALLLSATDTGEFAYCPREEQQRRIRFMKDSRNASVMLSMGWEVKDGDIAAPDAPDARDPEYIFTSIEETVRTERPDAENLLAELLEEARPEAEETSAAAADETDDAPRTAEKPRFPTGRTRRTRLPPRRRTKRTKPARPTMRKRRTRNPRPRTTRRRARTLRSRRSPRSAFQPRRPDACARRWAASSVKTARRPGQRTARR